MQNTAQVTLTPFNSEDTTPRIIGDKQDLENYVHEMKKLAVTFFDVKFPDELARKNGLYGKNIIDVVITSMKWLNMPGIEELKAMVRGGYDQQRLRMATGNRICANIRERLNIPSGTKEEDADEDTKDLLAEVRKDYKLMTDGLIDNLPTMKAFKPIGVISSYAEAALVDQYMQLQKTEDKLFSRLENILKGFPIWEKYLKGVKGCGAAMAGVILSEINISQARYVSSLWAYAGLDVAPDGRGRGRYQDHLRIVTYKAAGGGEATRMGITFNAVLKTKLFVLGTCLLKSGNEKYTQIYKDYKNRLEARDDWASYVRKEVLVSTKANGIDACFNFIRKGEVVHSLVRHKGDDGLKLAFESAREDDTKAKTKGSKVYLSLDKTRYLQMASKDEINYVVGGATVAVYGFNKSAKHRHNAAMRYMLKRFLADLYNVWRDMEGYEVFPDYAEAKLGKVHRPDKVLAA